MLPRSGVACTVPQLWIVVNGFKFYFTESAASKELRELIRKHLGEELAKLKTSMEEQIKTTEDTINRKLQTVERSNSVKGKGKKK